MGVGVGGRRVTVGSAPPVRPAEGWCCMTSYIALSLHENYAPSWKVWEGVRELVQNCHDGALQAAPAGCLRWVAEEPGSCSSFTCAVEGHGPETVARISYHPDQQRLILVNNDTGLQRKALLLGNSEKAESQQVVGQFGEGRKSARSPCCARAAVSRCARAASTGAGFGASTSNLAYACSPLQ